MMRRRRLPGRMLAAALMMLLSSKPVFAQERVQKNAMLELGVDSRGLRYGNAYNYEDIALRCLFEGPGGLRDTVDGFYMKDFVMDTTDGSLHGKGGEGFRVRYCPRVAGAWRYTAWYEGMAGIKRMQSGTFICTDAGTTGFVRRNHTRWLSFDNGGAFVPVGENMGWANRNTYKDYHRWLGRLSENGGNFIRVWMPSWGFGLEWEKGRNGYGGLLQYQQEHAYYLDWLLEYCREKGIYMMLALDHHGQVSSKVDPNWNENPYNAANGGPCKNTWDFFSDSTARRLIRNRFRYIVARYGYSTQIMSWELFNEVDWTDDFLHQRSVVAGWHREMAAWLRMLDPYKHLISTSYGSARYDSFTWEYPGIDFTQTHYYQTLPNLEHVLDSAGKAYFQRYGKPTLNTEFGLAGDAGKLSVADAAGIHIHNVLWGSVLGGGGFGTAMSWWWDNYIDLQDLYHHFRGVSRFMKGIEVVGRNYAPAEEVETGKGLSACALRSEDSLQLAGWVLNTDYNWEYVKKRGVPEPVRGGYVRIGGMRNGIYRVVWHECGDGVLAGGGEVVVKDNVLVLACPPVSWDLGFKATAVLR